MKLVVQYLKDVQFDERNTEGLREAIQCLEQLFDATIFSEDVCTILANDNAALTVLDDLTRQSIVRFQPAKVLALQIVVNVSNSKLGAKRITLNGGVQTMLDLVGTLHVSSTKKEQQTVIVALRGISNILIGTGGSCGRFLGIAKAATIALTLGRNNEELCESACAALSNLCLFLEGIAAALDARAHRAIFSTVLQRGVTVKKYLEIFAENEESTPATPLQVQALWALRNMSATEVGSERLVTDIPPLVAVATTMIHSDTLAAMEHSAGLLANCCKNAAGRLAAMSANTVPFVLQMLEISVYLENFVAELGIMLLTNMAMTDEGRTHLLEHDVVFPIVGLLCIAARQRREQHAANSSSISWCRVETLLGLLINLTACEEGREVTVVATKAETLVLALLEEVDDESIKFAALGFLRNTSAAKLVPSLTKSSTHLVQKLVRMLDEAVHSHIFSSGSPQQRTVLMDALGILSNVSSSTTGALKLVRCEHMERAKKHNGLVHNLSALLHARDIPAAGALDAARALAYLSIHLQKHVQAEAVQVLSFFFPRASMPIHLQKHCAGRGGAGAQFYSSVCSSVYLLC
jgi:hypothetical protein